MEIGVSLLLLSLVGVGTVGSIAVGTRAGSQIEEQDVSLIVARSQAEFVASQPIGPSYDVYPSAPSELDLTLSTGDLVCANPDFLQRLRIRVFRDEEKTATLDAFKSGRFLDVTPGEKVVPKSSGLERVRTITVPDILPEEGFAIVISEVFTTTTPTDTLVEWELSGQDNGDDDDSGERLRTLAIFLEQPFGGQTQSITTPPSGVAVPLVATGQVRKDTLLAVGARGVPARWPHCVSVQRFQGHNHRDPVTPGNLRMQNRALIGRPPERGRCLGPLVHAAFLGSE